MTDSTAAGWYYALQGERVGPRSLDDVRALIANGVLDADALVWTPGMRDWSRVGDVSILSPEWVQPRSAPAPRAEAEWAPDSQAAMDRPRALSATHPWHRLAARAVDFILYLLVLSAPVQALAPEFVARVQADPAKVPPLVSIGVTLVLGVAVVLFDALLLHLRGTTPGKSLFGLRVVNAEGGRPSLGQSLSRSARVWVIGMGAGLPFLSIIAPIAAYVRLASHRRTLWDEAVDLQVEHTPVPLARALRIVGLILLFLYALGVLLASLAPTP